MNHMNIPKKCVVNDKMQSHYTYTLSQPEGKNFHKDFKPDLSPSQMLKLGVFGGKYMTDCRQEFPQEWFLDAKLSPAKRNITLNFFKVDASTSLAYWRSKGWIFKEDPRGWFQWYCRYYLGRRIPEEDERQIQRWKAMKRHVSQLKLHCLKGDITCRPKQRQALLHWAYDSRNI